MSTNPPDVPTVAASGCPFSGTKPSKEDKPSKEERIARFGRDFFEDFDFDDPAFNTQLYPVLDSLLEHCPVARSNVGSGYWIVSRNEDVRRIGQDWRTFSSAKGYQPNRPEGLPYLFPEESDPPIHTAWRDALNPHLSPKTVAHYDEAIRHDVNVLIDRFIDKGQVEFISEFGAILPGWAFFKNILGVPVEHLDMLVAAVENGTFAQPPSERAGHFAVIFKYLEDYLRKRSQEPPRDDLVSTIVRNVIYPDGTKAPWAHQVSILVDITFGGIATTTYVMGSAIRFLAEHPADREALIDNPEYMTSAIEEFARVFAPVVALGRTCTRDTEIAGTKMKEGDFVMLNYAASSRDPRVVENPQKVDITRNSVLHSAFGVGPHRCIGSNLARLELRCFLEEWHKRIPSYAIKPGTTPRYETGFLRSMRNLDLVF
jgi:cytochrome P450